MIFRSHKKRTKSKRWPLYLKNWVTLIFVGQGTTKSCYIKILKSKYLSEFLRYGPDFLHVIMTFIDFKITFRNMGSYGAPAFKQIFLQIQKFYWILSLEVGACRVMSVLVTQGMIRESSLVLAIISSHSFDPMISELVSLMASHNLFYCNCFYQKLRQRSAMSLSEVLISRIKKNEKFRYHWPWLTKIVKTSSILKILKFIVCKNLVYCVF